MVRELGKTRGLRFMVNDIGFGADAEGDARLDALKHLRGLAPETVRMTVTFHFGWTPEAFLGASAVEAARFRQADTGAVLELPCDSAVTAIGFDDDGALDRAALLSGATGDGRLAPGLFAAGWFRHGPRGSIPENRADAQAVARALHAGLTDGGKPGRSALRARCPEATDHVG